MLCVGGFSAGYVVMHVERWSSGGTSLRYSACLGPCLGAHTHVGCDSTQHPLLGVTQASQGVHGDVRSGAG